MQACIPDQEKPKKNKKTILRKEKAKKKENRKCKKDSKERIVREGNVVMTTYPMINDSTVQ